MANAKVSNDNRNKQEPGKATERTATIVVKDNKGKDTEAKITVKTN